MQLAGLARAVSRMCFGSKKKKYLLSNKTSTYCVFSNNNKKKKSGRNPAGEDLCLSHRNFSVANKPSTRVVFLRRPEIISPSAGCTVKTAHVLIFFHFPFCFFFPSIGFISSAGSQAPHCCVCDLFLPRSPPSLACSARGRSSKCSPSAVLVTFLPRPPISGDVKWCPAPR